MQTQFTVVSKDILASNGERFANFLLDLLPQYAITYGIASRSHYLGKLTGNNAIIDFYTQLSGLVSFFFGLLLIETLLFCF